MPWEIYLLCTNKDGIDSSMYLALKTTLDTGDAFDLIEMLQVQQSYNFAAIRNSKVQQ